MNEDLLNAAQDHQVSEDDWAAALAEQSNSNSVAPVGAALFPSLTPGSVPGANNDIDMILDIPVQLTVELGRTRIPIKQILQLAQGSVIELDALAGEPMDVLVNGCLIA
ncbi:MAG: FliM/FliN family flagellar motor switch protein, partial [Burkholderiales bacterium]|nr:FliM/FliN family flagellar motor switch protein [Burkholderiales bacterium]